MGYAFMISGCVSCGRTFLYNPVRVPSLRKTPDGPREPLCQSCHKRGQEIQRRDGLEVWPDPHPDAYEPIAEEELPYQ